MKLKALTMGEPTVLHFEISDDMVKSPLFLTRTKGMWRASMGDHQSGDFNSPDEAAKKLGEILYRLATAIKDEDGNFGKLDLSKLIS